MATTLSLPRGRSIILALLGLSHLARSYQEGSARIGLKRNALSKALRTRLHTRSGVAQTPVVPLPNDTLSDEYWAEVNSVIDSVGSQTLPPPSVNDPGPTAPPSPLQQVFQASVSNPIVQGTLGQEDYSYVTPQQTLGQMHDATSQVRTQGVVPYDMALGAHIMYGLSERNTETPPPTQAYVSQRFTSNCPMVMMLDGVTITPPRCDDPKGSWLDPSTGRAVLRWGDQPGGVALGVDSAVGGPGNAPFATLKERFTLSKHVFSLANCMGVERYMVEEQTIKVNHMADGAVSTMFEHDGSVSRQAYFYKYVIKYPNGTDAAQSDMYRMDANQVNFSIIRNGLPAETITSANRVGGWRRDQWRTCDGETREWSIVFPAENSLFQTVATVQDLRVATAAVITLMAFRDEEVGSDGFKHRGQGQMYWQLFRTIIYIIIAVLVAGLIGLVCLKRGYEKKLKRIFFSLETAMLPHVPANERLPIIGTTY